MRAAHGVRHWFFVDNIFNMPIRHAKEICEEIAARELDIEWSGYLNPKFIDDELCALMARSGCKAIEFGTDSGSPSMIANLKKEFDADDLRRASALCHKHGLKFCHSLIFGGPGETEQTVTETIELMEELQPTAVIALTGIRVLPGTGMVDIALRDGQIDADDNLLYPKFYISPTLEDELIERIEAYARAHSNWIVPGQGHQDEHPGAAEAARAQDQRPAVAAAAMSADPLRLDGKRALVTGASRGIGRATAEALAAAGAAVAINYARSDRGRRGGRGRGAARARRGGRGGAAPTSPTRAQVHGDVRAPAQALGRRRHRGQQRRRDARRLRHAACRRQAWDEVLAVNLRGAFLCARQALRPMIAGRWGRIINVVSPAALLGQEGAANYAAAKGGLLSFSKSLAREVGRYGITVNAVCPGLIDTRLIAGLPAAERARHLERDRPRPLRRAGRGRRTPSASSPAPPPRT